MKEITFKSFDGKALSCFLWVDVQNPIGIIQLVHGLTSHTRRYADFAEALNKSGFIVFGDDHRMNGATAGIENLGKAGYDNFNENVEDELEITRMLKERYSLPVQLFSHSYGSFLAQRYIEKEKSLINGVIMSGSAHMGGARLLFGKAITFFQRLLFDVHAPGRMFYKITFSLNDKYFKDDKIKNAWISRDFKEVETFNGDPLCDFIMSHGFFYSLMRGLYDVYRRENLKSIRKDLPVLIMSGDKDPLGGMGEKVRKLNALYLELGLNVSMKLYENVRHELTSDFESERIIGDITSFFKSNLQAP